jgi:hypothetical protein
MGRAFFCETHHSGDEETVRNYIKHQESEDKRIEQLNLF